MRYKRGQMKIYISICMNVVFRLDMIIYDQLLLCHSCLHFHLQCSIFSFFFVFLLLHDVNNLFLLMSSNARFNRVNLEHGETRERERNRPLHICVVLSPSCHDANSSRHCQYCHISDFDLHAISEHDPIS